MLIVSTGMYGRYLAEPARYPAEVAFYSRLFREGQLLQVVRAVRHQPRTVQQHLSDRAGAGNDRPALIHASGRLPHPPPPWMCPPRRADTRACRRA